jgi:hypothetical protein
MESIADKKNSLLVRIGTKARQFGNGLITELILNGRLNHVDALLTAHIDKVEDSIVRVGYQRFTALQQRHGGINDTVRSGSAASSRAVQQDWRLFCRFDNGCTDALNQSQKGRNIGNTMIGPAVILKMLDCFDRAVGALESK